MNGPAGAQAGEAAHALGMGLWQAPPLTRHWVWWGWA